MSYRLLEKSVYGGKPTECFLFESTSNTWKYTSADEDIVLDGNTYTSISTLRTAMEITSEIHKSNLNFTFPKNNTMALQVLLNQSDEIITLTIFRFHADDPTDFTVYWKGRISGSGITYPSAGIKITCESIFASLRKLGVRLRWTRLCGAAIYDGRCNVVASTFGVNGLADSISKKIMITSDAASAYDDDYFAGGFIAVGSINGPLRHILSHKGNALKITRSIYNFNNGDSIVLFPGCDRTIETCINKFNNLPNFRGVPWIPSRNPFDGTSII